MGRNNTLNLIILWQLKKYVITRYITYRSGHNFHCNYILIKYVSCSYFSRHLVSNGKYGGVIYRVISRYYTTNSYTLCYTNIILYKTLCYSKMLSSFMQRSYLDFQELLFAPFLACY